MEWIFWITLVLSITVYKIIARYLDYKENMKKWGSDNK